MPGGVLGEGVNDELVFSLAKPVKMVEKVRCDGAGQIIVGVGANAPGAGAAFVPLGPNPSPCVEVAAVVFAFADGDPAAGDPAAGEKDVCAEVDDCLALGENCHPSMEQCVQAPFVPWDGGGGGGGGGDGGTDPPPPPPPPPPPDPESSSSSCTGRSTGCTTGKRWEGEYYVDEAGQPVDNRVLVRYFEGPGCPDLDVPSCSGNYFVVPYSEGSFYGGNDFDNVDECGNKTGSSGFGLCPKITCESVEIAGNELSGNCFMDLRSDDCKNDCAPVFELETFPPETPDGPPRNCITVYCRRDRGSSSSV